MRGKTKTNNGSGNLGRISSKKKGEKRQQSLLERSAHNYLSRKTPAFSDDGDMLEAASVIFRLRKEIDDAPNEEKEHILTMLEKGMYNWFKQARKVHPRDTYLSKIFQQYRLTLLEQDILLLLTTVCLGMGGRAGDIDDVQRHLDRKQGDRLAVMRSFDPDGRLVGSGIVQIEGYSEILASTNISVDPMFIIPLLKKKGYFDDGWRVETQDELLKKLFPLTKCYENRASELVYCGTIIPNSIERVNKQASRLESALMRALKAHSHWPVCEFLSGDFSIQERRIIIILLCREIGYLESWEDAGAGDTLAKSVSESIPEIQDSLALLASNARLRGRNYIRICGVMDDGKIDDDAETLRKCEFELTPEVLDRLTIKRKRRQDCHSRRPLMSMSQLVLHDDVREALDAALVQSRHYKVLFDKWGLGKTIAYGRSVTLLFSGPSGVGKTACAEALAGELGRGIMVADYSKIQDCFVGGTEKNICRVFRAAREENAVLFWDEADAMFYDRESADRNWEVRDVNVLLQELERFDGVCILSTNRKITLDKALERRISMKIEFHPPTISMSKEIWINLIPKGAPLEKNIDFNELANAGLTGGQIKNAVLNAARRAISRGIEAKICMDDFRWAIQLERGGSWCENKNGKIGFRQ